MFNMTIMIKLHQIVATLTGFLCGLSAIGNFSSSRVRLILETVTTFFSLLRSIYYAVFSRAQNTRSPCSFRGGFSSVQFCT